MDASSTQRLIKKMLNSSDLMPETREELEEHLADLEKGALHSDDARYIDGLARRLGFAEGGAPAVHGDDGVDDDSEDDDVFIGNERASDTAAAVQAEIALRKVEQARALVTRLRQIQSAPPGDAAGEATDDATAAQAATLDEIETALSDAAEVLHRND